MRLAGRDENLSKTGRRQRRPHENLSLVDVNHFIYKRWLSMVDIDATALFLVNVDQTELF